MQSSASPKHFIQTYLVLLCSFYFFFYFAFYMQLDLKKKRGEGAIYNIV